MCFSNMKERRVEGTLGEGDFFKLQICDFLTVVTGADSEKDGLASALTSEHFPHPLATAC